MYVLVNGAMEIDILFNIITKEHNFEITKDEFVCILSKTNGICVIDNFYVCIEGMDRKLLDELVILKKKIKNYKIITDLKQFKDDIDINNDKIKKLVNKYSSNKHFAKEVENVISSGQFCLNNLNVILDYFNINLPENKVNRMYKDLDNCQKNVRMFPLNGFTMNELSNKKKS
jgi:hypothetical protein